MTLHTLSGEIWTAALLNHLWQSTAVTLLVALLALALRANHARARYSLWALASIKFLVPFSLLIAAGETLRAALSAQVQKPQLDAVMQQITQPFAQVYVPAASAVDSSSMAAAPIASASSFHMLPWALSVIWFCGALTLTLVWTRRWLHMRRLVRAAKRMTLVADVPVLATESSIEPGIFGILHPVLCLPEGIVDRLSPAQIQAVIAHEMAHVRRHDNLMATVHMAVEILFWFHPLVWWINTRLMEERERACDESVLQSGNQADLYAESILNVCKFFLESPMPCVSGVTGSDLKKRIVRIMTGHTTRQLDLGRKLLLGLAATAAIAVPMVFGLVHVNHAFAQSDAATAQNLTKDLSGTWQGTLHAGKDLRIVLKISKDATSTYKSDFYSIDQTGTPFLVKTTTLQDGVVKLTVPAINGSYEGKLSADGKSIDGKWSQGPSPLALLLERAAAGAEWAIPEPPKKMAADANPSFEVATIKPSKPDAPGKYLTVQGNRMISANFSLADYISFAYGVHSKQVTGLPAWAETEKFDITAKPDIDGTPSDKQLKGMVQKLLAERFKLTFHHDKRELSVYILSVSKAGNKMTKEESDPNGLPGLGFRGKLGDLIVRNATMGDFTGLMQSMVLDRPVLDQTGLTGRWDFTLLWTPDDSQFAGIGARIPPPADNASAPPNLYTAIQEQIGLKLEATKAEADVLVIDKAEKPTDN
jgi:uncharacterized protein (TIGR03435 family)